MEKQTTTTRNTNGARSGTGTYRAPYGIGPFQKRARRTEWGGHADGANINVPGKYNTNNTVSRLL